MISIKRVFVGGVLLAALAAPAAVQASSAISMQVLVGDTCIQGTGGANKNVSATLKTPSGHKRDSFVTKSDSSGSWFGCFSFSAPTSTINGGDILSVSVGASSRTLEVPRLVPTIDRVANTISGRGAAKTPISVYVTHHSSFRNAKDFTFDTVSDSNGDWTVNTTGTVNLIGADQVVALTYTGNDIFGALSDVPVILVEHVSNVLEGFGNTGVNVSFTLLDSHGTTKGQGSSGNMPYGSFTAGLFDSNGDPAYPVGGDVVQSSLASDATLAVPMSELRGNAATDTVTGRCMANAPWLLLTSNASYTGRTDADGRFTKSVANKEDLGRGDSMRLVCMYRTGDEWVRTGTAS